MANVLKLQRALSTSVLNEAAHVVRRGGVLAVPTDTFYALGACALNEAAVHRICAIKGRSEEKPILVLVANRSQLAELVVDVTPIAQFLMDRFWPGPLTLIMQGISTLPTVLTAGTGSIGVRLPAHPSLLRLLHHVGPLTGTSANRSGMPPVRMSHEVQATLGSEIDLILDGGPTTGGMPSTVVDTVGNLRIVREGLLPVLQIRSSLIKSGFLSGRDNEDQSLYTRPICANGGENDQSTGG